MEFTLPLPSLSVQTSAAYRNWQHMKQRFKDFSLRPEEQNHSKSGAPSMLMFINGDIIKDIMKSLPVDAYDRFDSVFENIEDICMPSFILLYERFKFFSLRQKRFEDLNKFVSKIQILADFCELHEHQQKYVTDQIVEGVCSDLLRKHLQSISDLDLETALEICEEAHRVGTEKCANVTGQEISSKNVVSLKSHSTIGKRRIEKKSNVKGKKSRIREKKISVREKNGRHNSVSGDDQQKDKMETRSSRSMKAQTASFEKTDHSTEATLIRKAKLPSTSSAKHARSVKTLPKRQKIKPKTESFVYKLSDESQDVKIHLNPEACNPDISHPRGNKSVLPDSESKCSQEKYAGSNPAFCEAVDSEVYTVKDSQFSTSREVCMNYPQVGYILELKSEPEVSHQCHDNNDTSENKDTRKFTKCRVHRQEFGLSCEFHSRQTVNQVDTCSIFCDTGITSHLSQHRGQTHPRLFTSHCGDCQPALDEHRISHSAEPQSAEKHSAAEEKITCRDCGVTSSRKYHQHRKKKHNNGCYGCDQCGLSFPYPSKLKLHLMSKHNATKPFMCEVCGSSFAEKNMLATHKNIHTGEKKYECPTCGRRFLLKTTLSNHMQTHLDRRPHTCSICGMGFKLTYYLKSHMKTHSKNRERPHICSKCGAAFMKAAQLRNHERKHTGEKPYQCHECTTHFSQLSSMKKHIKQIHEGVKPKDRFSCEYCGLSFSHSCKLKLHLMKHTGERPFSCNFCGSTYREKHQLTTHMKIHTGSEPFKCPLCSRRFLQKSSLEGHVRKHTGEKPFQCHVCLQNFSHKGYLRDHVRVHDEKRERKYKCGVCDKAFTCSSHMRSHEKLHSGDKPHKCDVCGSRFTKRSSVKKHLKRTHGIQNVTALQIHKSNIVSESSEDAKVGMIMPHMQPVVSDQTDIQPGIQHQIQLDTQTHRETQTGRSVDLRPTENAEMTLQLHSQLHMSHIHSVIRPEALLDTHPQTQQDMSALQHQIHSHPGIHILHPGLHPGVHLHGSSQMVPLMTSTINTPLPQTEHIQEMLVYTVAS